MNLVIGKTNTIVEVGSPQNAIDNWVSLRAKFFLSEDRLIFYTPDTFYVQNNIGVKSDDSFKIIFGANDFENFKTSDVPSMSLRNVRLYEDGKLTDHWPLDEVEGNIARNLLSKNNGTVKNPFWLKQGHQAWESVFQAEMTGSVVVTFDESTSRIFIVGRKELSVFSFYGNGIQTVKYSNVAPVFTPDFKAIFNSLDKRIYCYAVDGKQMFSLDIQTGSWLEINPPETTGIIKSRHHNNYFYEAENSIYFFGGYGMHTYNNDIRKVNLKTGVWEELPSDKSIYSPRYLAGMGFLNDTLYILGGYGSSTGSQMVNPHSYFDLIGYSIKNKSLFKKFEIPHLIDDMCVVQNLDETGHAFLSKADTSSCSKRTRIPDESGQPGRFKADSDSC